jgi:PAS domain S-box-containing protein
LIHESSLRVWTALGSLGIGVIELDSDRRVLYVNSVAEHLLGASTEAVVGEQLGSMSDSQGTGIGASGGRFTVTEIDVSGNGSDATARLILLRALPESSAESDHDGRDASAHLAAIVADSDDAIVSKTLDGTIRSWNAGAERLFGYSAAEAVGRPITLIIPPELHEEERRILARVRSGERISHFETERVAKDGRRLTISLTVSPIRNASGQTVGASKVARDITQQTAAEHALRDSEERFRELANNTDQFAWTCNRLGDGTWYNRRWYEYTGTTFERMRGEGWKSVLHPDHTERVEAGLREALAAEEAWEDTFPLLGADGEYRWFLSRAVPILDSAGTVVRWFGTNTDVTGQLQLERELRQADRRKDEFIATLAHELRGPLAPIRNALELLNLPDVAAEAQQHARDVIGRQLDHMVRLIEDLLDVSRITRDRLELRLAPVELGPIVQQAVDAVRPLAGSRRQVVEVAMPATPIDMTVDSVRLAQVMSNLLENACKYSDDDGTIRVTVAKDDAEVRISVQDDGIGIAADDIEHIFEMFAQPHAVPAESRGGLGIGLTLARRLAELHGGRISAHSEGLGRGSEFVVCLPLSAGIPLPLEEPECARTNGTESESLTAARVLVVDDNVDSAESLAALFRLHGHDTRVCHDGSAAITVAEEFRPTIIVLDIGLPTLNGNEVCRALRRRPWGRDTTIVAVSGWGQDDDRRRAEQAGFDRYVVKPVDYGALQQLLHLPSRGLSQPAD